MYSTAYIHQYEYAIPKACYHREYKICAKQTNSRHFDQSDGRSVSITVGVGESMRVGRSLVLDYEDKGKNVETSHEYYLLQASRRTRERT